MCIRDRDNTLKVLEEKLMFRIQIHDRREEYFQFVPVHQPRKIVFFWFCFLKRKVKKWILFQNSNLCESSKCIEKYITSYGEWTDNKQCSLFRQSTTALLVSALSTNTGLKGLHYMARICWPGWVTRIRMFCTFLYGNKKHSDGCVQNMPLHLTNI